MMKANTSFLPTVTGNALLRLQSLVPQLDKIIEFRARQILAAEQQGRQTQLQTSDLNTLYTLRTLADEIAIEHEQIFAKLQTAHANEIRQLQADVAILQATVQNSTTDLQIVVEILSQNLPNS
jgi:hypothetical protein